jgi:hypothetical protein
LERNSDPLADRPASPLPGKAKHFDLAAGGVQQALNDFDRGRFAGAIRAQQAKTFPLVDGQIQPTDGLDL